MSSKLLKLDTARAETIADQAGMLAWQLAMLVIGLSLLMRLCGTHACAPIIALAARWIYPLGLLLIASGLLHLLGTAVSRRMGPAQPRTRYARKTWLPLWYHTHASAAARPGLRFDHGQAWAWGVQLLLAAMIIQTAAGLAAQQPLVGNLALLACLIPLHVLIADLRARITAHGHA
jgi:hypothetical protein